MRTNHQPRLPRPAGYSAILLCLIAAALLQSPPLQAQETSHPPDSSHSPGWVVISVPDYRALRVRAFPAEREPEPPPVDATLSRLDYDLRLDGDIVAGHATLTVDVLKNGWVRIPIPRDLFVRGALLDGKPLSLASHTVNNDPSQLYALLSHPGRATITLDIALPVTTSSARDERLVLPATSSGITSVSFVIPRAGVDLSLWGGIFAETKDLPSGNKWLVYGVDSSPITFAWKHKSEEAQQHATQPLRMKGTLTQFVVLGEDSTSLTANVTLEVTQGAAKEARVRLPENVTVNQVQGALVADWQMTPGELLITFLEPIEQSASFIITAESTLPRDGPVDVPILRLTGVERETGGLGVDVFGDGEIKDESIKSQGFLRADPSDLGEPVANRQSPALIAFRTHSTDVAAQRTLHIVVTRYTQKAVLMANVGEARYRVLLTRDGKSLVEARYALRNNQRSFVKITLPPGAALWSASLAGKSIRPGSGPDASLLVPLAKAKSGEEAPEFGVVVVYLAPGATWTDKGRLKVALPALDLPISRTGLQVFYPPQFRLSAESGSFHVENYATPISPVLTAESDEPPVDSVVPSSGSAGVRMTQLTAPQVVGGLEMLTPGIAADAALDVDQKSAVARQSAQTLVDKFHASERGSRASGILPVRVNFPAFGSSLYLVSELTSENQAPSAEFSYQQDKKAGGK
jgi:hypothetical protein